MSLHSGDGEGSLFFDPLSQVRYPGQPLFYHYVLSERVLAAVNTSSADLKTLQEVLVSWGYRNEGL